MKSKSSNTKSPKSSRPFVTANFALTWDGKIATRKRSASTFSSPADKRRLLEIRSGCDAILVGKTTVERDNMTMGLPAADLQAKRRGKGQPPLPQRVLVSNSGKIDPALRLFKLHGAPTHIYSTVSMPATSRKALATKAQLHLGAGAAVDLAEMLQELRLDYGVKRLVCEGGATLLRSLLQLNLVDEIHITFCPVVFGGAEALTITGLPGDFLQNPKPWRLKEFTVFGNEGFALYRRC